MAKSVQSVESGETPHKSHDWFFKTIFENAKFLASLIKASFPDELLNIIDLSTLKRESPVITTSKMTEVIADLVFSVKFKGSGEQAYVYLIFEHKSGRYRFRKLIKQITGYQFHMHLQNGFKTPIIPIVVFQGEPSTDSDSRKAALVEFIDLFKELSDEHRKVLSKFSINFQCVLIDINEIDRQGLARGTNIDGVIRAMSKVRGAGMSLIEDVSGRMMAVARKKRGKVLQWQFEYISVLNPTRIKKEDLLKLKGKTPEEQEMIQAATEILRQEARDEGLQKGLQTGLQRGRDEGLQKGREEVQEKVAVNLLQKGMDLEMIVEVTDLSRNAVQKLQREIDEA